VADLASITTDQELENDEELLRPLDRHIKEYAYWEQQIDAILTLVIRKSIESIDK
jgi:hypothetical protein